MRKGEIRQSDPEDSHCSRMRWVGKDEGNNFLPLEEMVGSDPHEKLVWGPETTVAQSGLISLMINTQYSCLSSNPSPAQ